MNEYGLVLMLMAFGILCGLSGYSFGYAERDKELERAIQKDDDQAYDEWYETKYSAYEIATGAADFAGDEAQTDWSNWK